MVSTPWLPPGGSQEEVAGANSIQCTHPFRERWVAKSPYHLQIIYSRNRPAARSRRLHELQMCEHPDHRVRP